MRLINTKTKELRDFNEKEIPPYCVLSHTWGQDEVLFQDFGDPSTAERKAGFSKIERCCDKGAQRGIGWAWVDTCCINKSSSAELSEAINSMFVWYKNSEICFAYLSDIPHTPGADYKSGEPYEELFESRWFTRGWTLQEMLAPDKLILCDSEWNDIGTKEGLSKTLSEISGIDKAYLLGEDLSLASIAQRMSWAASRETTRTEDIAYCLMGIFDVNMPLLYGEGPKAFIRLQEEIIKESTDQSLFAWKAPNDSASSGRGTSLVDPDRPKLRGILARSPSEFILSSNIVPTNISPLSEPFSMTNNGLRIQLPLKPSPVGHRFLALLACREEDDFENVLAIYLSPLDRSSLYSANRFRRVFPSVLGKSPVYEDELQESKPFFITKDFEGIQGPHEYIGVFSIAALNATSHGYRLTGAFPSDQWNPLKCTIEPSRHTKLRLAALRFDGFDGANVGIVLAFGFTTRPYRPFCNIATSCESSFQGSLKEIVARNKMYDAETYEREVSKAVATKRVTVRLRNLEPLKNHIGVDITFSSLKDKQTPES